MLNKFVGEIECDFIGLFDCSVDNYLLRIIIYVSFFYLGFWWVLVWLEKEFDIIGKCINF